MRLQDIKRQLFMYQRTKRTMCEGWVSGVREAHGINGVLACDGCELTYCCRQLPLIHPMEGVSIAVNLLERGLRDISQAVIDQGEIQTEIMARHGYDPANGAVGDPEMAELGSHEWYRRGEDCALLKDGRCVVYGLRPISCYSYFTQKRCERHYDSGEVVPTMNNMDLVACHMVMASKALDELLSELADELAEGIGLYPPVTLGAGVHFGYSAVLKLVEGSGP